MARGTLRIGALLGLAALAFTAGCGTATPEEADDDSGNLPEGDVDGDGFNVATDCDDGDAAVNPGTPEVCNGADDNCSGTVDEGFDRDVDGHTQCAGDCDDAIATTYSGAPELCNAEDDDCDGAIDEDWDGDLDGISPCAGDCDDGDAESHPGAPEVCDCRDQDCNGAADDGLSCPTADCVGPLEGAWTGYVWWIFGLDAGSVAYIGPVFDLSVDASTFTGTLQLTYFDAGQNALCSELWGMNGLDMGSDACPDCLGVLTDVSYSGPTATDCGFAGYPILTGGDLGSFFTELFYSDLIDEAYTIGSYTVADFVDYLGYYGNVPEYELYMDIGDPAVTPLGLLYR